MNFADIRKCDIADGEGCRVGLYVSGCRRHCFNCHNKDAQSFEYGAIFTKDVEDDVIASCMPNYIAGLSILGGEPLESENVKELVRFVRRFKDMFGKDKTIWVYTGCLIEDIYTSGNPYCTKDAQDLLTMIDVLVDGPYVESLRDPSLSFRGSSNQRIIRLNGTDDCRLQW